MSEPADALLRDRARRRGGQSARDGPRATRPSPTAAAASTARSSATGRASCASWSTARQAPCKNGPESEARARAGAERDPHLDPGGRRRSSGTGRRAAIAGRDVAGKTGTTENYGDAWFVGYTPQLAVAVWVGYPATLRPMLTEFDGDAVAGGTFPAEIFKTFVERALAAHSSGSASVPGRAVPRRSGALVVGRGGRAGGRQRHLPQHAPGRLLRRLGAEDGWRTARRTRWPCRVVVGRPLAAARERLGRAAARRPGRRRCRRSPASGRASSSRRIRSAASSPPTTRSCCT